MVPMETLAVTVESAVSTFWRRPTTLRALWKQAAYPAANNCSGLVPPPFPPMDSGTRTSRSKTPSLLLACPSRPPVVLASAVYSTFFTSVTMAHSSSVAFDPLRQPSRRFDCSGPDRRRARWQATRRSDAPAAPDPEATDQFGRGPVLAGEVRGLLVDEGRGQLIGHGLAQLDTPLVERIDAPDHPFGEDGVLVERHQLAEHRRGQPRGQDGGGRAVPGHDLVGDQRRVSALGRHLLGRATEGQHLGLGKAVGHEQILLVAVLVRRVDEADEVGRDELRPLVNQLVEGVLPVGAGLAPEDLPCLAPDR